MQPIVPTSKVSITSTGVAGGDITALPLLHYPAQHALPAEGSNENTEDDVGPKRAEALPIAEFGDALLAVANALLREAGQDSRSSVVSAVALPEKPEQDQKGTATARSEPAPGVQQMLDILLKAGQSVPLIDTVLPQAAAVNLDQMVDARGTGVRMPQEQSPTLPFQSLKVQQNGTLPPLMQMTEMAGSSVSHTELKADLHSNDHRANVFNQPSSLKLEGGQERWSHQLQSALGERLQMQFKEQTQHATIRLDPPTLGKIDISLQIENGRIQVHINASQGEVYRALSQISNELRQSLTEQNFIQVNVQVSSQSGQQQREHQQETGDPEVILASEEITHGAQSKSLREDGSILLTV